MIAQRLPAERPQQPLRAKRDGGSGRSQELVVNADGPDWFEMVQDRGLDHDGPAAGRQLSLCRKAARVGHAVAQPPPGPKPFLRAFVRELAPIRILRAIAFEGTSP